MSSSAFDVVSTTTGMERSSGSDLISASTSRPSLRGRFRSSSTRSGREFAGLRRNSIASTPSPTILQRVAHLVVLERLLDQDDIAGVVLDQQDADGLAVVFGHRRSVSGSAGKVK